MKVAVLGAGLMGRIMSLRLYQSGFTRLTIIEKDTIKTGSSPAFIAAGMLACFNESVMGGELIYTLGKNSIGLWQGYLSKLKCLHLLNTNGTLLIAPPQFFNEVKHYIGKIGFNTHLSDYYQLLNQNQLRQLETELNFNSAYFLPDEGVLNASEVMRILGDYLFERVNWRTGCVVSDVDSGGHITIKNKVEKYDWVFDCRGVGAQAIYPKLRAVRGEIIRVYAPEVNLSRPVRLFHPRHNIYISPMEDNHYAIGATEIEAADYSAVSVRSTLDLLNCANSIHSGFAEARIVSLDSNCRPTLYDNLPKIKHNGQLIGINGLYRHGFLVAPALAEEVIQYLRYDKKQYEQIWSR